MGSAKEKYGMCLKITGDALSRLVVKEESALATQYLRFANDYVSDAKHYAEKDDYATALEAVAYAHGFIDAGVLAGVFEISEYHLEKLE